MLAPPVCRRARVTLLDQLLRSALGLLALTQVANRRDAQLLTIEHEIAAAHLDKARPVVVYCASGARSAKATAELGAAGYSNVVNGGGLDDLL